MTDQLGDQGDDTAFFGCDNQADRHSHSCVVFPLVATECWIETHRNRWRSLRLRHRWIHRQAMEFENLESLLALVLPPVLVSVWYLCIAAGAEEVRIAECRKWRQVGTGQVAMVLGFEICLLGSEEDKKSAQECQNRRPR